MRLLLRLSINHNRLAAPPGSVKRKKEPFDARVMRGEAAASGGGSFGTRVAQKAGYVSRRFPMENIAKSLARGVAFV